MASLLPPMGADEPTDLMKYAAAGVEFVTLKCAASSLARLLGISMHRMRKLEADGKLYFHPKGHPIVGHIDVFRTVRAFCIELQNRTKAPVAAPASAENDSAEEEYRRQKTRMARLNADKLEGSLVSAMDVERMRTSEILRAKARLLSVRPAVMAELAPHLRELDNGLQLMEALGGVIDYKIDEALAELARQAVDEDFSEDDDDGIEEGD